MVELGTERYRVRQTPKRRLREVDFLFEGETFVGLSRTRNEIPLGANGTGCGKTVMQSPQRGSLRGKRGLWEGHIIREGFADSTIGPKNKDC